MKIDTCILANVRNIWKTYKSCVLVHNSSVRVRIYKLQLYQR